MLRLILISTVCIVSTKADETQCLDGESCPSATENNNKNHHHSWLEDEEAADFATTINSSLEIPVYNLLEMDPFDKQIQSQIYDSFFNSVGAFIVRGAYTKDTMRAYNKWCEGFLEIAKKDGNCRHPKQKNKYLINDIIMRLGKDDPNLLMALINNRYLTLFSDILLGFMKYGAVTTYENICTYATYCLYDISLVAHYTVIGLKRVEIGNSRTLIFQFMSVRGHFGIIYIH